MPVAPVPVERVSQFNNGTKAQPPLLPNLLTEYGIQPIAAQSFGTGLINATWMVDAVEGRFIFQKINSKVFPRPEVVANNLSLLAGYLANNYPEYLFPAPLRTLSGNDMVMDKHQEHYRLMPFVKGSHSIDVLSSPDQAYAAAQAFGKFTRLIAGMDSSMIQESISDFHNLDFRYAQFLTALEAAPPERLKDAAHAIDFIRLESHLVAKFNVLRQQPDFRLRIMHHDTKISNVLFNDHEEALCVIDLDTVMPGYFISDLGDMIRTYTSPVSEEEVDISKIVVRQEYFAAVIDGYLSEMGEILTTVEKDNLLFSGQFMIYMQALRFLTDYLQNDVYYGASYPKHNLNRALNQSELYRKFSISIPTYYP